MVGIYRIDMADGRSYVGSSVDIASRWKDHYRKLLSGKHHSPKFQAVWNKYGSTAFFWSTIERCTADVLIEREQWWIDNSDHSLNIALKASGGGPTGWHHTPESKAKISAANKGYQHTQEARAAMSRSSIGRSPPNKGIPHSPETREKLRIAQSKNRHTPESRAKMCIVQRQRRDDEARQRQEAIDAGTPLPKREWSPLRRQRFDENKALEAVT